MKRHLCLLLIALIVGACSAYGANDPPPPKKSPPGECGRTFLVAPEFPSDERAELAKAVDRWNVVALESFCLRDSTKPGEAETSDHGIYRIHYGGDYWKTISQHFGGEDILGVYWGASDQIGIVDGLDPITFQLVALHELGHAHGLEHTACPAIMCPWVGSANDFTPTDTAECVRVGACEGDAGVASDIRPASCVLGGVQ